MCEAPAGSLADIGTPGAFRAGIAGLNPRRLRLFSCGSSIDTAVIMAKKDTAKLLLAVDERGYSLGNHDDRDVKVRPRHSRHDRRIRDEEAVTPVHSAGGGVDHRIGIVRAPQLAGAAPSMNFLDARAANGSVELAPGLSLKIAGAGVQDNVVLGVRPEHVRLETEGLPALVKVVEPTGSEIHLVAEIAGQDVTAVVRERYAAQPGETVGLRFDPAKLHLFDPKSGRRIER